MTVAAGDVAGLEQALARVLSAPPPRYRFAALAQRYTWQQAAQPLVEFCLDPRRAPDLVVARLSPQEAAGLTARLSSAQPLGLRPYPPAGPTAPLGHGQEVAGRRPAVFAQRAQLVAAGPRWRPPAPRT